MDRVTEARVGYIEPPKVSLEMTECINWPEYEVQRAAWVGSVSEVDIYVRCIIAVRW